MSRIPEGIIDEIQTRTDIAELISRYVPLKRSGRHYKALCPFHQEKTPSFMVNPEKQVFHCFGCGVGGNIFSFLMQHDRLTFPEAVRQLADHVGVQIPEHDEDSTSGVREALALMEKVAGYFERTLRDPKHGEAARAYLERRGVSDRTRDAFRLGLAPVGWDQLLSAAAATGVASAQLEAVGLVIKGRSHYYDRFRNRLIFPILDLRGRVIGFGGRSLDAQEPKYLNSPETGLYSKGRSLFGLFQAKDAMVQAKTAIVVEGYFDCLVLADAGFTHVVSPLGTAFTQAQGRLLKRYVERVILAFDADAAGEQATLRGIDLLVEAGLRVQVARLPSGVDPDECLRSYGRERFERLLDQSLSLFDFVVQVARRRHPGQASDDRVQAARFALPTLAKIPDAMLRREYVRLLAERLRLDEGAVAEELAKAAPRSEVERPPAAGRRGPAPAIVEGSERLLTALVLEDPARWEAARASGLSLEDVTDARLVRILGIVCERSSAEQPVGPAHVVSRLSEPEEAALVTELVALAQATTAKEEALQESVRRLARNVRRRELARLQAQIRAAQDAKHDTEVQRLLAMYQERVSASPVPVHSGS